MNGPLDSALIVYDGDCIFCQNYVELVRLRETVGQVELLNARTNDPRVRGLQRQGYDLNEGMVFIHKGKIHYGSDAIHMLALLSSPSNRLNRLNRRLLSNRRVASAVYPLLKAGRRVTLFLRGRQPIAHPKNRG